MAENLGKYYIQVMPSMQGISKNVAKQFNGSAIGQQLAGQVSEGAKKFDWKQTVMGLQAAFSLVGQGMQKAGQFFDFTDNISKTQARLKGLTSSEKEFDDIQKKVRKTADTLGVPYSELAGNVSKLGMLASEAFGGSAEKALEFSTTLQKGFTISGAGADEAGAATKQLTQALASGVLRGDEFNSMMENAPYLAQQMAGALGINTGELRKMAGEGELTADTVVKALGDATDQINKDFEEVPMTFDRVTANIKTIVETQFLDIADAISKILASKEIKNSLKWISDKFVEIKKFAVDLIGKIAATVKPYIPKIQRIFTNIGIGLGNIWTAVKDVFSKIIPYIEPIFANLVEFGTNAAWFLREAFDAFAWLIEDVGGFLVQVAGEFAKWVTSSQVLLPLLGGIGGALAGMVAANMVQFFMGIATQIGAIVTTATTWLTIIGQQITATGLLSTAQEILNVVMSANPIGLVLGVAGALVGVLTAMAFSTDSARSAQDKYNATLEDYKTAADAAKGASDSLAGVEHNLKDAKLAVERATTAAKEAEEKYGAESIEARQASSDLEGAVLRETEAKNRLIETQDTLQQSTIDGMESAKDAVDQQIADDERSIESWESKRDHVKEYGTSVEEVDRQIGILRDHIQKLRIDRTEYEKQGRYVVQGLTDGLKDPVYVRNLQNTADWLARDIKERTSNALKINSPSKVFMKIGASVTEGLALGISETTKDAVKAVSNVADAMIKEAGTFDSMHASLGLDVTAGSFVGSVASGHVELRNAPSLAGMELRDEYVNGFVSRPVTYVNYANPALTAEQELRNALMKSAILAGV
jgi:tape measure domain-containing protein